MPDRDLADGEVALIQGSAARPYEVKNTGGIYSCTCPAWRNQSKTIDRRTCKHIRGIRGTAAETERIGGAAAAAPKSSPSAAAPVLLAQKWEPEVDITGWWLSEKLDGVRAYWTGTEMLSRLGNRFEVPDWFADDLGAEPLDGELWVGRGAFQDTVGIVRRGDKGEAWRQVKFLVFDGPSHAGGFEERVAWLRENFAERCDHVEVVDHVECTGADHVATMLAQVEALGGEGLMARKPGSFYVAGRSSTLLKIKTFLEDEAIVVGYVPGAGRHKGRLGSLEARLRSGVRFNVGTGLSDAEREAPPVIGAVINVRFQELTRDGVPRFPSFVGERVDVVWDGPPPPAAPSSFPAKSPPLSPATPSPMPVTSGARMFELTSEKSAKFWEVAVQGSTYTVRYGRIGSNGTTKTKELASEEAARSAAAKLIAQKTANGYVEQG